MMIKIIYNFIMNNSRSLLHGRATGHIEIVYFILGLAMHRDVLASLPLVRSRAIIDFAINPGMCYFFSMSSELEGFFYPRTVALIGATDKAAKPARTILENLAHFDGAVYPVNPKHKTLLGHHCYASVAEIPESIDLAIVALPAPLVECEIDTLKERGIRRLIVISSGYAEAGGSGVQMQSRIAEKIRHYGMRLIGPNALGVYNTDNGLDSFFVSRERVSRPVAGRLSIVSQSGAITVILMEALSRDGIGVAKAVNYGNRLDVDDADCLDYFAGDPKTGALAMYIESVADGQKFLRAAKEFTSRKPLVVWKAGKFEIGAAAVASHTATLAGRYGLYRAAIRQAGAVEAEGFDHMVDAAKAVAIMDYPCAGKRLLIVTNGGGMAVAAADQASREGFVTPRIPDGVRETLKQAFPPFFVMNNPIDITGSGKDQDYYTALKEALPHYDAAVVIILMGATTVTEASTELIARACHEAKKPVTCCILQGLGYTREAMSVLLKLGVPVYPSPERAVRALAALRKATCRTDKDTDSAG
jgi:acyl-CoA synthetase (NDP forming)